MTTSFDAGANRLGALALKLTDRMHAAGREATGHSESSAAALSALGSFLDTPRIDQLAAVLGLSSSATVRLVDRLVTNGLATRDAGADGRVSVVSLTAAGRDAARAVADARAAVLAGALDALSATERATFHELAGRVLVGLVGQPSDRGWMCRLCDTATCGAPPGEPCPITRAALG